MAQRLPDGIREEARKLYDQGLTLTDIGEKLEIHRKTVGLWLQGYSKPRDNRKSLVPVNATSEQWSYLAAFLDGEGCIRMDTEGLRCSIIVGQQYPASLYWLQSIFGGVLENHRKYPPKYRWSIRQDRLVRVILKGVLPYIILKRPQVIGCLKALNSDDSEERKSLSRQVSMAKRTDMTRRANGRSGRRRRSRG